MELVVERQNCLAALKRVKANKGSPGMSSLAAAQVAANARRCWRNSAMAVDIALPNALFDKLGVPRLAK